MNKSILLLLLFGITLLSACQTTDESYQKPDDNRFTHTALNEPGSLDEPMAFTFLNTEDMLVVERKGGVKSFNVESRVMKQVGFVPVNTKYVNKEGKSREAEEGLMGIIAHPNFAENNWVFMLYAEPDEPKHVLARWEYNGDTIVEDSKIVVLEYPTQRAECCHTGGGMVFDKEGNLLLTTGNNTVNPPQGTSNLDERPGREYHDDQRTSGNSNDLRGKILRIHPEDDGTYTIPEGNLFAEGTPKTRPEIYTMGHRNPWRVSIDSKTGYIYWGEVGPDAGQDTDQGSRGYDEFNQAKGPGFFGWPYFIGDNQPYADYDYATDSIYGLFDVEKPVNTSPNNTGIQELPPPQKAFIWYPYANSEEFPLLGSAGRNATGGPVFRLADFPKSDKRFPAYYDGKWLIIDFMRGWIMSVTMDANGDYVSMEPFLPMEGFQSAIDIQFSPDGDLYVLEYGSAWFRGNDNSLIKRIQFNGGNRPPIVKASADKTAGALPLTIQLSSEGTVDYDEDKLTYEWTIVSEDGTNNIIKGTNPSLTLEEEGLYNVYLTVTDDKGNSGEQVFEVTAGNEPPEVAIEIAEGNQSFYFPGNELAYAIQVTDQEDGSVSAGSITPENIAVNFDYAPEGFDPIEIAQNHVASDDWIVFSRGKKLIDESDCLSCHRVDVKSIGPSYVEVAKKYKGDPKGQAIIADRIINGSVGYWGEHAMSAHPNLSKRDAKRMVDYIMGLNEPQSTPKALPLSGNFQTAAPKGTDGKGAYLLRVAYTDKGTSKLEGLTTEKIVALRNPRINPEHYDEGKGTQLLTTPGRSFNIVGHNGYLGFNELDLTGITEIEIGAEADKRVNATGATIEVRLDTPDGQLIGTTEKIEQLDIDFGAEYEKVKATWEKGGKKGPEPNYWQVRESFKPTFTVPITDIEGKHNVYFVFKNADAQEGQILVQMNSIEFKNGQRLVQ